MPLLDKNGLTEAEYLAQYDVSQFERPSVATDMAIFTIAEEAEDNYRKLPPKKLKILLVRRGVHPYLGQWALPGGFLRPGETAGQSAERELREETGVAEAYLEQLYTFSEPDRDPRTWVLSCSYMALVDHAKMKLKAGDDADEAAWFDVAYKLVSDTRKKADLGCHHIKQYMLTLKSGDITLTALMEERKTVLSHTSETAYTILENNGLAFDHAKIIACAIERLRGKIEYTDIAFGLMPERFTLTELQNVYEVILGRDLLKAAFRRKIEHMVEKTDEYTENAGHRPSRLYKRKREDLT